LKEQRDGAIDGSVPISDGTQKILVDTRDNRHASDWPIDNGERQRHGTVHLYDFLGERMSNAESSKTLSGVALALMVGHYLFKTPVLLHLVLALLFLIAFPNRVSKILAGGWLKFGEALGVVNSKIILTAIYFLVLVPVSFCYRRLNPKVIAYYKGKDLDSFFIDSTTVFTKENFEKTW
jgi:hypothetical protein